VTSTRPTAVLLALVVVLQLAQVSLAAGGAAPGSVAAVVLPLVAAWVLWRGGPAHWVLPGLAFAATDGALAIAGLPAVLPAVGPGRGLAALLLGLTALTRAALLPVALPGLRGRLGHEPVRGVVARLGTVGTVVLAAALVTDWVPLLVGDPGIGRLLPGPLLAATASALLLLGLASVLHAGRDRAVALGVLAALVLVAVPTLGGVLELGRAGFAVSAGTWVRLAASLPLVAALLIAARGGPPGARPVHPPGPA